MPKREPSIHVSRSVLYTLIVKYIGRDLGESIENDQVEYGGINLMDRVNLIMKEARQSSLDHRSVVVGNKKVQEQATKRVQSSIGDANLLADVIYSVRVKLKHVGVSKIKQTDMQWAHIKQLVPVVNDFCERYNFEARFGYIEFVTIGLNLMSKAKRVNYNFAANWLFQRADWIINTYESINEVNKDSEPEYTVMLYNAYQKEILDRVGLSEDYRKNPQEYVWFVRARKLADEMGIDYETFIQAQFYALEFCNGIPKIEDLSNDKARSRVINYMAKFNITSRPKIDDNTWESFKQ